MKTRTSAYVSGGICGKMWMGGMGSIDFKKNLRGPWGLMPKNDGWSFQDMARSAILGHGGDFQDSQFTADTIIRIERIIPTEGNSYKVHVKEILLSDICPEWTNTDIYTGDFWGEEDF